MGQISLSPRSGQLNNREHALMYCALGWRVFPVHEMTPEGACSCKEGTSCDRPGKHPRITMDKAMAAASASRNDVEAWWNRWPGASVGIATGAESNLTVIDADASEGKPGVINLTQLCATQGGLPATLVANTGGGGLHLYFTYTDRLKTGSNVLAEAIDVRNDGGYVIAPPSNHRSGKRYSWRSDKGELIGVPEWLLSATPTKEQEKRKRRGRPRQQIGARIERVESMLAAVDPDDRDKWLGVGVILGRLYLGSPLENDAWTLYETWAARSAKFDEERAANLQRMREAFHETSQTEGRGGSQLGLGSLIYWARNGGWKPFGDRVSVAYEPGSESIMAEALAASLINHADNRFFNVMGQVRDVLKTQMPIVRLLQAAAERGEDPPETLVVRQTTSASLLDVMSRTAVLETLDKNGNPRAQPISGALAVMVLDQHATRFPVLSGIAEWPMVGADGNLITREHGYDATTGLFFDIDKGVRLDETLKADEAWAWLKTEFLADFPFEDSLAEAGALALLLAFMQRPLMKTCPAFAATAPQPLSGKSTLIEVASLAIHGHPVMNHAWSSEDEELRKAIHSLLLAKTPAVLFDNIKKGTALDSDHVAKLLTAETAADRTLGASDTRKEVNSILMLFTGNNIAFVRDLASRVIVLRLNAKMANPLRRKFVHSDVKAWAGTQRNKTLSCLVAILRDAIDLPSEGLASRFEDFDRTIARAVLKATGEDVRKLLEMTPEVDSEADDESRTALKLLRRWQQNWRDKGNGDRWKVSELSEAVDQKTFDDAGIKILRRWVGDARAWEADVTRSLGFALRNVNGDHKFEPLLLTSAPDLKSKVNTWFIENSEPDEAAVPSSDRPF